MKPRRPALPIHPIFFALFPALAFLAVNIQEMYVGEILRPIAFSLLAGAVLLIAFRFLLGGWPKAALATSVALLVLLAYGQFYTGLKTIGVSGTVIRHRYFLPALIVIVGLIVYGIYRLRSTEAWTRGANAAGLILMVGPAVALVAYAAQAPLSAHADSACAVQRPEGTPPDVYLIVLDAYERSDVLQSLHGFDNGPFLDGLRQRGFYPAEGSMSNYRHTKTSLASTMNMEYVQDFPERLGTRPDNPWDIVQRIRDSQLRRSLECLGYRTVAVETGFPWTELTDADFYLKHSLSADGPGGWGGALSASERVFLTTTALRAFYDAQSTLGGLLPAASLDPDALHRQRVEFAFDELPQMAQLPSPKFVFVHIVSPHPPFVFGPQGQPVDPPAGDSSDEQLKAMYADQVAYLNARLLEGLDAILSASEVPPIVVLMGDHGYAESNPEQKMSIFNAYHLPGEGARRLYPTITPVNSFRVVLDEYFGGNYELLPDVSYYSKGVDSFDYEVVPNTWKAE